MTPEDRTFLQELQDSLWHKDDDRDGLQRQVDRISNKKGLSRDLLTSDEVRRIFEIVLNSNLITEMIPWGMFGGVGVRIYGHEQYVGTGPELLLMFSEQHLPKLGGMSWHEDFLDDECTPEMCEKPGGSFRQDAYLLFLKFANTKHNLVWCEKYGLEIPGPKYRYEY